MAQPQQVVDPNVNPPPTEQELLEYRVKMYRLVSAFREEVQVRGVNAYTKLIHELKITVSKFNADLVEADKKAVLKSIKRHDGQHFKQGFVVKVRATASREHHPDFSAAEYDVEVHSAICKLHLDAADMSQKMADIHYNLALIKTKVSPSDFIKISTSIPLPLTTVEIVDPAKPSAVDIGRNQNRWNQATKTNPKHNRNHSQTSCPRQSRRTFALFVAQPASILVTYARNHLAHWKISGCTLMYTARCHASFVTENSSMSAAWMNTYRRSTRSASYHSTIASWTAALSGLEHRLRVSDI